MICENVLVHACRLACAVPAQIVFAQVTEFGVFGICTSQNNSSVNVDSQWSPRLTSRAPFCRHAWSSPVSVGKHQLRAHDP